MAVILASQSPRRQELLTRVIADFDVVPAEIDETIQAGLSPEEYVMLMATEKAEQIAYKHPEDLVIGCDTIVTIEDEILGKPTSREDAFEMLKKLSGIVHQVQTSVVLIKGKKQIHATVKTNVSFYELADEEINQYLDTGEYKDKAGAYGIQGKGALFVERILGDYYAVMGLPISKINRMLHTFD